MLINKINEVFFKRSFAVWKMAFGGKLISCKSGICLLAQSIKKAVDYLIIYPLHPTIHWVTMNKLCPFVSCMPFHLHGNDFCTNMSCCPVAF